MAADTSVSCVRWRQGEQTVAGVDISPQKSSALYCAQAWYTFLALARLEDVCFGTVRLLMSEHKHGCATWT